jgi:mRNA interferase RelE/StbE
MYEVVFDGPAIASLSKLPNQLKERIFSKILSAKADPFHFFERLEGRADYKLRVGDYRIIADIDQTKRKIEVTRIGHRKNVYDKA